MKPPYQYRWPTKIKRYGITDPFLKVFVAKYEREISWQVKVRDEETLIRHIQVDMLPRFLARIAYPPNRGLKHFYASKRHIDLDAALVADPDLDDTDLGVIELIRSEDGENQAKEALLELINGRKAAAFQNWIEFLEKEYQDEPAFWLLLLRSVFELSGQGTRRAVVPPSPDVIEWLHRRFAHGRLSPNENIARIYCLKLSGKAQTVPTSGWQFIASERENAPQLAAASRGSGWCIADHRMAAEYLYSNFYILRHQGKPVVALRVSWQGKRVIECQGRGNTSPHEWFPDISLFLQTQGLILGHRQDEMDAALKQEGDLAAKHAIWWQERVRLWPFATLMAPPGIKARLMAELRDAFLAYVSYPEFHTLAESVGLTLGQDDWRQIVEIDPLRYIDCPGEHQAAAQVRRACLKGWVERVEDDELTMSEIVSIPDFVKLNQKFREVLRRNLPSNLRARIRQNPRTYQERRNRLDLEKVLPGTPHDSADLAVERLVNVLLNNEDGNYTEEKVPNAIRMREDFPVIRERAWLEAMQAHPPLWFALPSDLASHADFLPTEGTSVRVDLSGWIEKVVERPWMLTQKNTVPKSIRRHRRILNAYREGWLPYLRKAPWRIWIKRGLSRRVYMSYALLADEMVIETLAQGWRDHMPQIEVVWRRASDRMRELPALQVSVIRAICSRGRIPIQRVGDLNVCRDVARRLETAPSSKPSSTPLEAEIRSLMSPWGLI